jgi:hypothetical protein
MKKVGVNRNFVGKINKRQIRFQLVRRLIWHDLNLISK